MEKLQYDILDGRGDLCGTHRDRSAAVAEAQSVARETQHFCAVLVTLGQAAQGPSLSRYNEDPEVPRFWQTAAVVPIETMREAVAALEGTHPDLAAELRASLVAP